MRRNALPLFLVAAALGGCAAPEQAARPVTRASDDGTLLAADGLGPIQCLVLAPFENTTELPELGEVATAALVHSIDPDLAQLFPVRDLRALFRRTPLELPDGVSPRLALALGERVGSQGVLYGSVEGRVKGSSTDFLVNVRLQAVEGRELLFARTAPVRPAPGETVEVALRRTLVQAARPMLDGLGARGARKCFHPDLLERAASLRDGAPQEAVATAAAVEVTPAGACPPAPPCPAAPACPKAQPCPAAPACPKAQPCPAAPACPKAQPCPAAPACKPCPAPASPRACPEPAGPVRCPPAPSCPPAAAAAAAAPAAKPDPRVTEMKGHLRSRSAFLLEDVVFAGRSPVLVIDDGLEKLAAAMKSVRGATIMLEVYVDATEDPRKDFQTSMAMAVAATRRLEALGVSVERVAPMARGGAWPIVPNDSSRARAANRRIEVVPFR